MSDPSHEAPHPVQRSVMNRFVTASLRQPLLVVLVTLILLGAGIRALDRLPVDAYPDLSPPIVEVITQWPGHAAEEVERLITVPVERGVVGIPRMTALRSICPPFAPGPESYSRPTSCLRVFSCSMCFRAMRWEK